jgi:Tfp pilus assembly protein PilP
VNRAITFGLILAATSPASGLAAQAPAAAPNTTAASHAASAAPRALPTLPLSGQGYTYRVEGRRDPFVSLARRGSGADEGAPMRIAGLAGLGVGEITLRGTLQSDGGYVGIVQGADNKTYIVRAGARLADGTIRTITPEAMVILQHVNDPLSLQKQREVRKMLRHTEEAK